MHASHHQVARVRVHLRANGRGMIGLFRNSGAVVLTLKSRQQLGPDRCCATQSLDLKIFDFQAMVGVEFNYFERDLLGRVSQIVCCAMNAN